MSIKLRWGFSERASISPPSASVALSTVCPAERSRNIASSMFVALSSMSRTLAISTLDHGNHVGLRNEPQLQERLVELLPGDRLLHDSRRAEREALISIRDHRDDDDRDAPERREPFQVNEQIPSVHRGQEDIERDQRQQLLAREDERRLGRGGLQHFEPHGLQLQANEIGGLEIVLDDERRARFRARFHERDGRHVDRRDDALFRRPEREPYHEAGALPDGAFDRDAAAVQLGEKLDHGETESGALVLPGQPAVDLTEGLEQVLEPLRRDADA